MYTDGHLKSRGGILIALVAPGFLGIVSAATAPTFDKEVAPILFKNCVTCHRPGEIGSKVSFLAYDTARPWAKSIREKVVRREMPPWSADPAGSVKFRNDARLSQRDIDTLAAWVDAGGPKGNDADLPQAPKVAQGWQHPSGLAPDLVITFPGDVKLPASGDLPYLRHLIKVPIPDDKWVVASQVRAGNPAVVHHMAITEVALDDGMTPADLDALTAVARQMGISSDSTAVRHAVTVPSNPALFDMLGVYTPGTTFEMYGEGSAKLLKGGNNLYLNFNIHYQTSGKPEKDKPAMAFWFQPGPPKHQLFRVPAAGETIIANGKELLTDAPGNKAEGTRVAIPPIPPHEENYELIGVTAWREPVTIYQFQPHAHLRGKDFKYTVVYPDGREQTVLTVPKFDFNWQLAYELDTPLRLPAGSSLVVTAHYDNPAPEKEVYFRPENQSWDEMFTPFIQYTIDSEEGGLEIAEVVGCLKESPSGMWILTDAGEPVATEMEATSSTALKQAAARPPGNRTFQLLGTSVFKPASHKGQKTAVRGVLIPTSGENRLNVTSLQTVAGTCPGR